MTRHVDFPAPEPVIVDARDWIKILAKYRQPDILRSVWELCVTVVPFLVLWGLAWWSISVSLWLALGISVVNAAFLLRLFVIQHDCGHGSFFENRKVGDWVGRFLGVLTVTPYAVWRRTHSIHHGASGNLDHQGVGDIVTLTVSEYQALSKIKKIQYRLYRHPVSLFLFAPAYIFLLQNRLPLGLTAYAKYWVSAMTTNAAILFALGIVWYFGGFMPLLLVFLPTTVLAATAGMWLFYVQHQFEETFWDRDEDWQIHEAALHGSSHYVMPSILQWFSANIGIHHVHHLYSRIPFYRLPEVLEDNEELAKGNEMTIRESLINARLHLWDEKNRQLLSFKQADAI